MEENSTKKILSAQLLPKFFSVKKGKIEKIKRYFTISVTQPQCPPDRMWIKYLQAFQLSLSKTTVTISNI